MGDERTSCFNKVSKDLLFLSLPLFSMVFFNCHLHACTKDNIHSLHSFILVPIYGLLTSLSFFLPILQPEQIRQCLVDYASISVWDLEGGTDEAPGIRLAAS